MLLEQLAIARWAHLQSLKLSAAMSCKATTKKQYITNQTSKEAFICMIEASIMQCICKLVKRQDTSAVGNEFQVLPLLLTIDNIEASKGRAGFTTPLLLHRNLLPA